MTGLASVSQTSASFSSHSASKSLARVLAIDPEFVSDPGVNEEWWSNCPGKSSIIIDGVPVHFDRCDGLLCESSNPLRKYRVLRIVGSTLSFAKVKRIDEILHRNGFPTYLLPIIDTSNADCGERLISYRYMQNVGELCYSSYYGFNGRAISRLAVRTFKLVQRLHEEFRVGLLGKDWLSALVADDWHSTGDALIHHSGQLVPICTEENHEYPCISQRDDFLNLTRALLRLSTATDAAPHLVSMHELLESQEGGVVDYDFWIHYLDSLSSDTEWELDWQAPPNQEVSTGSIPLNSLLHVGADEVMRICSEMISSIGEVHKHGFAYKGDNEMLDDMLLEPSGRVVFSINEIEATTPQTYRSRRRTDLISMAYALWRLAIVNSGVGLFDYHSHPYDIHHALSDFFTASLLLGKTERPAYERWRDWFMLASYHVDHLSQMEGPPALKFQFFQNSMMPFVSARYGEGESFPLALFDTGSNVSYAMLVSLDLTDDERAACRRGLTYGSEWCLRVINVDGTRTMTVHLGESSSPLSVDTVIHVTDENKDTFVKYLVGAGPESEFARKYPVFTFVPNPVAFPPISKDGEAGTLYVKEMECFSEAPTYISTIFERNQWMIPAGIGVNPSNDQGEITFTKTEILLDTGASFFDLPAAAFDIFIKRMAEIGHPVTLDDSSSPFVSQYVVPDCTRINTFPNIHIAFGLPKDGLVLTLSPAEYLLFPSVEDRSTCNLVFQPITDTKPVVMGMVIVSKFIIEFNSRDNKIGLCRS